MAEQTGTGERGRQQQVAHLESLAESIRFNLESNRRPLFVEFAGLPKSGKTTAVNSLALFLRRNGIPVRVVAERASVCPIRQKVHLFFNTWTGCTSLTSILEALQVREHRVVLLDRGILDTLIWMTLLRKLGRITDTEHRVVRDFFLLDRWRRLVDVVIYMTTTVESALQREFKDLLTEKPGSVMNESTLDLYLRVAGEVIQEHRGLFRKFLEVDTNHQEPVFGVERITKEVLNALVELSDEELVVVPLTGLDWTRFQEHAFVRAGVDDLRRFEDLLATPEGRKRRTEAETDTSRVQLVACAVITYRDRILVTRKLEAQAHKRLHGARTVWVGGHLRWEDLDEGGPGPIGLEAGLRQCLRRELREELGLHGPLKDILAGFVYDTAHPRSIVHLGIVFRVELEDASVPAALDREEFREYGGQGLRTEFVPLAELGGQEGLETWSVSILRGLFGLRVPWPAADQLHFPF